jgi:hypothetical protein
MEESEFLVPVWTPADNIIWISSSLGWRIAGMLEKAAMVTDQFGYRNEYNEYSEQVCRAP